MCGSDFRLTWENNKTMYTKGENHVLVRVHCITYWENWRANEGKERGWYKVAPEWNEKFSPELFFSISLSFDRERLLHS